MTDVWGVNTFPVRKYNSRTFSLKVRRPRLFRFFRRFPQINVGGDSARIPFLEDAPGSHASPSRQRGGCDSFLNISEALSSAKVLSLNQSKKVLLCSFKTQFFDIFGLLSFTKPSWRSMYGKTSLPLFNTYKWAYYKPSTLGVITCSPLEPLPLTLSSCQCVHSSTTYL